MIMIMIIIIIMCISCYRSRTLFSWAVPIVLYHRLGLCFRRHYYIWISTFIVWCDCLTSYCTWILLHISRHQFINLCLTINLLCSFLCIIFGLSNRSSRFLRAQLFAARISNHLIGVWILNDIDRGWIILK